jgi:integrase
MTMFAVVAEHDDSLAAWQWPLDLSVYDRRPHLMRREAAALARRAKSPQRFGDWSPLLHEELGRLTRPIIDALAYLQIRYRSLRGGIQHVLTLEMHRRRSTYWAWSEDTWHAIVGTSRLHFEAMADGPQCRAAIVAVAMLLQRPISVPRLGRFDRVVLTYRLFGRHRVDAALERLIQALGNWGYALEAPARASLRMTLCEVFLTIKSPCLEQISLEALIKLRKAIAPHKALRGALMRLSRGLVGLGILATPLNPWAMNGRTTSTRRERHRAVTKTVDGPTDIAIEQEWVACVERWRATSTLSPKARDGYYSQLLMVGRWASATYGNAAAPARWTRDMAAAAVAMILRKHVGEWTPAATYRRLKDPGRPLLPRTQLHFLNALSCFFGDCQEWEWMPRRFHPARAFAQPRSLYGLVNFQPRVISDDSWAKLLWAGLNLTEADLPPAWKTRHFYPLTMTRAVMLVWLFAGLRQNEIRRLRVGCIRFNTGGTASSSDAVCLLDVPVNKTSTAFTKPVDRVVGDAIRAWEQERPAQPPARDEKTGEQVHFLFSLRCARFSQGYLNRRLIPALCRKAGVPREDARGRITSHRARSTIATQLFNARQPLSLFELQAWLGHSTPQSTQHYARLAPTKLARAYTDAAYFQRNLRTIDVLIDQEAIRAGTASSEAWRFYDLGHGYCTYDFFDQCPHRMACAKCAFYRPKGSATALFVEGKAGLLRLKQEIPLTDAETAAVDDGVTAFDHLLTQLADVPTPAGPTPRQLQGDAAPTAIDKRRA